MKRVGLVWVEYVIVLLLHRAEMHCSFPWLWSWFGSPCAGVMHVVWCGVMLYGIGVELIVRGTSPCIRIPWAIPLIRGEEKRIRVGRCEAEGRYAVLESDRVREMRWL